MGRIAHLRNQFVTEHAQSYDNIITWCAEGKNYHLLFGWSLFVKPGVPFKFHQRIFCAKFGWNWPSGYGEKDFNKFHQCIFTISLLSPLGKVYGPSFEHNWIPFIQGCFLPSLVEIGPVVMELKIFKFSTVTMYCCHFVIISPLEKGWPFI